MANNFPNLRPTLNLDMIGGIYVDPRVTFTRAGTRTYFGREVVKAEENLLIRSQEFDDAAWVKTSVTVTANAETAPDGTSTAETITATSANLVRVLQSVAILASTPYALSVSIKAGTSDFAWVTMRDGGGNNRYFGVVADLSTGTITQTYFGGSSVLTSSSIVSEGNGWYRVSIIGTLPAVSSLSNAIIGITDASTGNAVDLVGNVTASTTISTSISLWQAQLEQRAFVTAPTVTTTQPITRYQRQLKTAAANEWPREFDPVTGECLGRSVWESRTNRCLHSEDFGNAAWVKTNVTVATNQTIAPDGTLTADQLTASAGNGTVIQDLGAVASAAKTGSLYLKRYTGTGNIEITLNGGSTWTAVTLTNTWTRFNLTATLADEDFGIRIVTSGDSIFAWGGMVETGAFMTPYIPTVASQVTRLADSAVMTGVNFSSWYRQDEGAFFVEAQIANTGNAVRRLVSVTQSGLTADSIQMAASAAGNEGYYEVRVTNAVQVSTLNGAISVGQPFKLSLSYKTNDFKFSTNAATVGTDTDGLLPNVARLDIGNHVATPCNGYIKRLTYYNQALTSANHQAITR